MIKAPSFLLSSPETIEGVGAARGAALAAAGIKTIAEFFRAGPRKVHALCPNATAREVGEWICQATLYRVKGVTPDLAEALVKAGIRSVGRLASAELADVEAAVVKARASDRPSLSLSMAPTVYNLARIQQAAWKLEGSGMVVGRLLQQRGGQPIRGALVALGEQDTTTDDQGWYAFEKVAAGLARVRISIEGRPFPLELKPREVAAGKLTGPIVLHIAPAPSGRPPLPVIREIDGSLIANSKATRVQLQWKALEDLPEGTCLLVRHFGKDGLARLLSFYKEQVGRVIYVTRARAKPEELPPGAKVGDVLRRAGGRLEATSLTPADVAAQKRSKWESAAPRRARRVLKVKL